MPKFLISLFTELASVIGGGVAGSLSLVVNIMQKGFGAAMQFHQEGIALARDLGLSASQAQAYTQALTESTIKLANKYGVTADAIKAVQRGISESTGRQLLLNDAQREQLVIANKLVGAQTTNQFTAEIMNHLGGQVSTVEGAISKAYATASKQGLNAQKFSATVAKNLSMANKLSFRDGVNGIIRMTALSEKLGFNLQSVESAANKFMELDSAIESSAQLQMLGGAAGAYGSNPLTMAYEANYDPEAFTERMTKMLGGYAQFDTKTGMANVNGMNRDFVKNIAQAMGISMDEAMTIAKKNAEVKFKESQFSTQLTNRFGNDEATKNYILNNSTYNAETKRLELNGKDISAYTNEEIAELKRMSSMSDHDLMVEQAQALTSLPEKIEGAASQVAASFASGIERYIPDFRNQIGIIGDFLSGHAKNWGQSVGQVLASTLQWLETKGPKILDTTDKIFRGIDKLISSIGPIIKWVIDNPWKSLFAFIAGKAALNSLTNNPSIGAKALGRLKHFGTKAPKLLKVGGAALGVGIGAYKAFTADNNAERGEGIGMATGAVIGTAIAGPLGAAVGGWLGGVGGKLIGEHWEEIKYFAKGTWDGIKDFAKGTWDGIKDFAKGIWDLVPEDARNAIYSGFKTMTELAKPFFEFFKLYSKGVWEVIKGTALGVWDITKGAAVGAWSVIKGTALGVWETIKGTALGIWEVVKGMWNGLWDLVSAPFSAINDIVEGIKNGFSDILNGNILDGIMTMLGGVGKGVFDIISAPFKAIYDVGQGMWNGIGEFAKGMWNGIGEFAKGIWNGIGEFVKGIWSGIGNFVKGIWNGFLEIWYGIARALNKIPGVNINVPEEKHEFGGIVGGHSYNGDKILAGLNSGEMVLNKNQQSALFNFINEVPSALSKIGTNGIQTDLFRSIGSIFSSIVSPLSVLKNSNDVKAKPVGEKEYVYTPTNANSSNGFSEITVKDINVNINGTLKLDAGNFTKNIDINQLLNDSSFVSQLKDLIKESINNDMNGGRFMNDNATLRGSLANTTYWGR